jgi:hypothetical protein
MCDLLVLLPSLTFFFHFLSHSHQNHRQRAAQFGAFGLGSAILAHRTWPNFQSVSATALRDWFVFLANTATDLFCGVGVCGLRVLARRQTLAFKGFLVSISRRPRTVSFSGCGADQAVS